MSRTLTDAVPTVVLTPHERAICLLLDATCRWITHTNPAVEVDGAVRSFSDLRYAGMAADNAASGAGASSAAESLLCEARIAGGWVRDKLLGLPSHDLDVSLSTLTGHNFALFLQAYLSSDAFQASSVATELVRAAPDAPSISHIGKIAANPEQSKNLETATARVLGLDLDFVNLRKEAYEGTSRIPIMSFGTPREDALRRDITVNALFYNVHADTVEDWTGHGLADLRAGLVRTPLEPAATFEDDPLRILRCVRFASRFGYEIHADIRACLQGQPIGDASASDAEARAAALRESLLRKVSRERFGIEIDKMLSGRRPLQALELLTELRLYDVVFMPPPPLPSSLETSYDGGASTSGPAQIPPPVATCAVAACLDDLLSDGDRYSALWARMPAGWLSALREGERAPARQRLLWYAVALLPLRHAYVLVKKKWTWAGQLTISQGLKLGNRQTKDPVGHLYTAARLLERPRLSRFTPTAFLTQRSTVGLLLRHSSVTNVALDVDLSNALLFSMLCDLVPLCQSGSLDADAAEAVVQEYAEFWTYVERERLLAYTQVKPLLDGRQVLEALQCDKPLISQLQPFVLAWQMDHESEASVEDRQAACMRDLKHAWEQHLILPDAKRPKLA